MKKITAILLVLAMCMVLMTTGAFAKVKADPASNGKATESSEVAVTEEDTEENTEEATDTEKQLNPGQQKKADREAALTDAEEEGTANQAKNKGQAKKLEERIRVRGMNMKFDVPPVIKEGRTLIPVRAIMNGLKAEVVWDEETKIVTITRDDKVVTLNLLTGEAKVNGEVIELDVPPEIISNRTFVPLRFVAQSLGEKVDYDDETGEIDIGDGEDEDADADDEDSEDDEDTDDAADEEDSDVNADDEEDSEVEEEN